MTSHDVNLESPNVKADHALQATLTYEEIVEHIQEKIQVYNCASQFYTLSTFALLMLQLLHWTFCLEFSEQLQWFTGRF